VLILNYRKILSTLKSIRKDSETTESNLDMQYNNDSVLTAVNAAPRTVRQHREEFAQEIIPQKPKEIRETIDKSELAVNTAPRTLRQPRMDFAQDIMSQKPKENRETTKKPEITIQPHYEELSEDYSDLPEISEVREIGEEISYSNENTLLPMDDSPHTTEMSVVMNTGSDMSLDDEIARLLETDSTVKLDLPSFKNVSSTNVVSAREVSVFDREQRPHHEAVVGRQAEKLEELDKKKVRPRI